jgi:hypothetical protein
MGDYAILALGILCILFTAQVCYAQVYVGNTTSIQDISIDHLSPPECKEVKVNKITYNGSDNDSLKAVIDHNQSTFWSGMELGSRITLDLNSQIDMCYIEIAWDKGNSRSNNYSIHSSNDGISFKKIGDANSSGKSEFPEEFALKDVEARYIAISFQGNGKNDRADITELKVYAR